MTGYGRGTCEVAGRRLVTEVRSVNHRFLEVKLRLPWSDAAIEAGLTQLVRARLERGVVSVSVRDEGGGVAQTVHADVGLAKAYGAALEEVAKALGIAQVPSLELIAAQPGVLTLGESVHDGGELAAALKPGLEQALEGLIASRTREGVALAADLTARLATLETIAADLETMTRGVPELYRKRLHDRLERALKPGEVDEQRLAQEVAILAERLDVAEELTRLSAHIAELKRLLAHQDAAGRRLDFLTQELNREINTIGSKSQSAQVAARIVDAKAELERMREQIQNVE